MYNPCLNLLLWKSWPIVQIGLVTAVPYDFQLVCMGYPKSHLKKDRQKWTPEHLIYESENTQPCYFDNIGISRSIRAKRNIRSNVICILRSRMYIHNIGQSWTGVRATFVPFAVANVNPKSSVQGWGSRVSIVSNCCIILVIVYPASVSANCWPMQIRGPPLKGRYAQPGLIFSHLSGRNSSASGPKTSVSRCSVYTLKITSWPLGTWTGDFPSGPPPTGR